MKKLNYITLLFFVAFAFASCTKSVWMEEVTSVGTERSEIVDGAEFNTNNVTQTNSSVSNNNRNSEGGSDITDDEDDGITDDEDEDDTDQTGKKKK
ncbi:MAG: hypothetical protein ACEQSL_02070 [Sediminibacterium sp.]